MSYLAFRSNTRNLLANIDENVHLLAFDGTSDRNRISAALFDITHDHAKAILISLENSLFASAYALARPLFETFVRAAWIQYCANENEINHVIKKDEFKLEFGEMLSAIEERRDWEKTLSKVKKTTWKTMHSFTHGGKQLIARRFKDNYIEHDVDELELMGILQFVALISFLSLNEMIEMSIGYETDNNFLSDLLDDLCQWCFIDLSV